MGYTIGIRTILNEGIYRSDREHESQITEIGPLDRAHIALALDANDHEAARCCGSYGSIGAGNNEIVITSDEDEDEEYTFDPVDDLECEIESELEIELDDGELSWDEVNDWTGSVWDGHNHVVIAASRSARFVCGEDVEYDGHVKITWECNEDGYRYPANTEVTDGWIEVDGYATNGYGNEGSCFDLDTVESVNDALGSEKSEISFHDDGASNAPGEFWMWVVAPECENMAINMARHAEYDCDYDSYEPDETLTRLLAAFREADRIYDDYDGDDESKTEALELARDAAESALEHYLETGSE